MKFLKKNPAHYLKAISELFLKEKIREINLGGCGVKGLKYMLRFRWNVKRYLGK